jgi:hypothetical protein
VGGRSFVTAWRLEALARRLGHYAWVEQRLFEVLGALVAGGCPAPVGVCCLAHAQHHAWHAELWRQQLPNASGFPAEELVVAPGEALAGLMNELCQPGHAQQALGATYRVALPRLVVAYSAHLGTSRMVSDGPVRRACELVLADESRDWREGEALLQSMYVCTNEQIAAIAKSVSRAESAWVAAWPAGASLQDGGLD